MNDRNLEEKITYYFGAGASANAIPTVDGIISRLPDFRNFINRIGEEVAKTQYESRSYSNFNDLKDFIFPFIDILPTVPSIDTLAKRLYDQERLEEYGQYKIFLVLLFNYLHYYKQSNSNPKNCKENSLEGRYENLLRSIHLHQGNSKTSKPIPSNFNFISWNYDFHLELTTYRDLKIKLTLKEAMHDKLAFMGLGLVNLNGTSLMPGNIIEESSYSENTVFEELLNIYYSLKSMPHSNPLKFAWEDEKGERAEKLEQFAKEAKYVIVIGYSFPSFNRDIDNAFFQNLKAGTKVYTQGYNFIDSERIKNYLVQTLRNNKTQKFDITPVESPFFYIPAEYFLKKFTYGPLIAH